MIACKKLRTEKFYLKKKTDGGWISFSTFFYLFSNYLPLDINTTCQEAQTVSNVPIHKMWFQFKKRKKGFLLKCIVNNKASFKIRCYSPTILLHS